MRVAVSSCLLGVCCKYSGGHNRSDELLELLEGHGYIRLEEPERRSVGRPADVKIIVNPTA